MSSPPVPVSLADRLARLTPQQRERLRERMGEAAPRQPSIPVRNAAIAPLSPAQQRFWFLHLADPDGHAYNGATAVRITGPLDRARWQKALARVVTRHDALRTVIEADPQDAGAVRQRVLPDAEPVVAWHDLSAAAGAQHALAALLQAQREQPFDPARALTRYAVVRLADDLHVFAFCLHHLVTDGWSIGVFLRELQAAYVDTPLPALPLQFGDLAAWQADRTASADHAAQLAWWRARLAGAPAGLDLPLPAEPAAGVDRLALDLPADLATRLRAFSAAVPGTTAFVVLLAALEATLHGLYAADDIVVANAVARRDQPELQGMVGNLADLQLLRTRVSGDLSFLALATRVRDTLLDAQAHGEPTLAEVIDRLERDAVARGAPAGSRRAPSDVLVSFLNTPQPAWDAGGLRFELLPLPAGNQDFTLTVTFHEDAAGLRGQLFFRRDRLDQASARAIVDGLRKVLDAALEAPQLRLADLLEPMAPSLDADDVRAIEQALRGLPEVQDVVVRLRASVPVAWLVLDGPCGPERIESLVARLPQGARPGLCCPVARIPLTDAGRVDDALLARLPLVEPGLLRQLESQHPGACAVVLEADDAPLPRLEAEAPPPPQPMPAHRSQAAEVAPPAIADGGPLDLPADAPRTLVAALQAAAAARRGGIVYAGRNRSEPTRAVAYDDLYRAARARLGALRRMGLEAGSRAILSFDDPHDHLASFWACLLGGIVPVTVAVAPSYAQANGVVSKLVNTWEHLGRPPVLTARTQAAQMAALPRWMPGASLRVISVEDLEPVDDCVDLHVPEPTDTAFIQLSSGSTGVPKCIAITHQGVLLHVHGWMRAAGLSGLDVSLNWLPLDHVVPLLTCHLRDLCLGRLQVIAPTAAVLAEPLYWLDLLEQHRVTHTWAPNFAYRLVSDRLATQPGRRWDLSSVRWFVNAGEQVTAPVVAEFIARTRGFGLPPCPVHNEFGMAELCTTMTHGGAFDPAATSRRYLKSTLGGRLQAAADDVPASDVVSFVGAGRPIPGVRLRIADAAGATLPEGVIGRLQAQGGVVTPGYIDNPEANAAAFADAGWFDTGDLGFIAGGALTLTGRAKETIIVRGANFYCHEIEDVVSTVPDVEPTWVACVAAADAKSGSEGLVVFYVPSAQAAGPHQVRERVSAVLGATLGLRPTAVVPLTREAFPKTTSGKIQRAGLAAQWAGGAFTGHAAAEPDGPGMDLPTSAVLAEVAWVPALLRPPGGASATPWMLLGDNAFADVLAAAWTGPAPLRARTLAELSMQLAAHRQALQVVDVTQCAMSAPQDPLALLAHLAALAATCESGRSGLVRLAVVTRGAETQAAAVRSALGCWSREAGVATSGIALPGQALERDCALLREELDAADAEPAVAWRDGRRSVRRLQPLLPAARPAWSPRQGMRCLLTGGLGAIGLELAQHLQLAWHAQLLVVGRRPEADVAEALVRLRGLPGSVHYVACDVASDDALAAAVAEAEALWGAPLDFVAHLAGHHRIGPLRQADPAQLQATLAPKVAGTRAALRLLEPRAGAFAVLFGSILAHLPRAGAAAYAAANAVLESEAEDWVRTHGPRCRVVAWSGWTGMGLSAGDVDAATLHATTGQVPVTPDAAWRWLDAALAGTALHVVAGVDPRHWNVRRVLQGSALRRQSVALAVDRSAQLAPCSDRFGTPVPVRVTVLARIPRLADGTPDRAAVIELLQQGGSSTRREPATGMERRLADLWMGLLGRSRIGAGDNFFALGGHSLLAMQLVARIHEQVGVELPPRAVFEAPTLEALAGLLEHEAGTDEAFEEGVL